MATLHVSLDNDGNIMLAPYGDVTAEDWLLISNWWKPGIYQTGEPVPIVVSAPEFTAKKRWLRENWTRLGHSILVNQDVVEVSRSTERLIFEFERLAENPEHGSSVSIDAPGLKRVLTAFQERNVKTLLSMPNGANFSVPGAGKTSTTLVVWEHLRRKGLAQRLLIICPRSAFETWETEPEIVLPDAVKVYPFSNSPIPADAEILFCNYEQLENEERLERLIRWTQRSPVMLVLDEAHRIKGGEKSARWRACFRLCHYAARVDLLTGTPMPQSQEDLRNLLSLSWRGIPRTYFDNTRISRLKRGGIFVRTTKRELELPAVKIHEIEAPMSPIQAEIYSALRKRFAGQFFLHATDYSYFERKGKAVMTLLAAATNPGLLLRSEGIESYLGFSWPPTELSGDERLMSILQKYSTHEISSKYKWIAKYVNQATASGKKTLIWSSFVGNLLALKRLLSPYNPALIYGGTLPDERILDLKRFRESNDCSVLLSNPQTLGEGVSLHTVCHEAIYLDRSYNAGLYLQSLDRIHRLGLRAGQETTIFILKSEGTIDFRVARRLHAKIDRLGAYLNDAGLVEVSFPTADEEELPESLSGLDDLDLNDLLDHLKNDG